MRVIARTILGLAAVLALIAPSAAANIQEGDPTGDYTRSTDCAGTSTPRAPVSVVFLRFGTEAAAMQAIANEVPWPSEPAPQDPSQTQWLNLVNSSGSTSCRPNEDQVRVSPISNSQRNYMRLWSTGVTTAATPIRQEPTNHANCGAWVTRSNGYNFGRDSFENAFQGPDITRGPYPIEEVNWGNTQPIQLCNGDQVAKDGNVAIIQQKDSFGYNDNWAAFSANPSSNPAQNPRELAEAQGATVARYAINWRTVGLAGSVPVTAANCLQMGGNWGNTQPETSFDRAYRYVTGRGPCDDTPPTTGIRPVLAVLGAPDPYARWCIKDNDADCVAGDCISTFDRTPATPQQPGLATHPAVAGGVAADDAWKGFVQNVALRYPLARGIEIWNEPNLTKDYWGSCLPGPTRYAQLLGEADEGVAASGTGTPVVLAGMSPQEQFTDNRRWTNYLNAVFAADPAVPTLFNVMGLHPYRSLQDRDQRGFGFAQAAADDVNDARDDVLAPNGIPLRTIWVTEVGATTAQLDPDTGTEVQGAPAEREGNQATALGSIYYRLRNMVPVVLVHRLIDPPYNPPPNALPPVEAAGYGAITSTEAANPLRRKDYYYELCQRRAITGVLCTPP